MVDNMFGEAPNLQQISRKKVGAKCLVLHQSVYSFIGSQQSFSLLTYFSFISIKSINQSIIYMIPYLFYRAIYQLMYTFNDPLGSCTFLLNQVLIQSWFLFVKINAGVRYSFSPYSSPSRKMSIYSFFPRKEEYILIVQGGNKYILIFPVG